MDIDLRRDWTGLLKQRLDSLGFDLSEFEDDQDLKFGFFSLAKRLVPTRSREVHVSDELTVPDEVREGLETLKGKFENGRPVWPHQSKQLSDIDGLDPLLFDWGIQHFHLGAKTPGDSSFVNRTGPLLFAIIKPENAYFIDVEDHGAWAKREFLWFVKEEWGHLLDQYRLKNVVDGEPGIEELSEKQRQEMRNAGVNSMVELDGNYYRPPGGGVTSAGTSMDVVIESDRFVKTLDNFERYVRKNADALVRNALDTSEIITKPLRFSLTVQDGHLGVVEQRNEIFFRYLKLTPILAELLHPEGNHYQGITDV